MPKVSIITPCYNSEAFIPRTIQSVQAQTFMDWEHLVVDDGSTDNGPAVVEAHAKTEPRLRLIRQPNGGVCNARNNGYAASSIASEYLLFLDADDCLEPDALASLVCYLEKSPVVGVVFCECLLIDTDDAPLPTGPSRRLAPFRGGLRELEEDCPETPFVSVLCGARMLQGNSILRRSVYERSGGYDEDLGQHHEDLDLFLRMALQAPIHYLPRPLFRYRRHEGQSSSLPERHRSQSQKFDAKWKNNSTLPVQVQALVKSAFYYRDRRLAPIQRLQAGISSFRAGNIRQATRHGLWAAMRYMGVIA